MPDSVLDGPDLFDRMHDLNAFAYFGMIPNWSLEYWPDPANPRATVVLSKRKDQRDLEKWVQDVWEEVDKLEKLLPGAQLKAGLFDACLTTRTAAKARLAYDKGASLSIAELAALSRVSMKRLLTTMMSMIRAICEPQWNHTSLISPNPHKVFSEMLEI